MQELHQSKCLFYFSRSKVGEKIAVSLPEAKAKCFVYIDKDKFAYAVLADDQYPENVVNLILRKLQIDFKAEFDIEKYNKI